MAASLLDNWNHRQPGSDLSKKAESTMLKLAVDVSNEGAQTPNHDKRLAWAQATLTDKAARDRYLERALIACVVSLEDPATASDADITNTISGTINVMAGV